MGALTSKPYAFTARPWELRSREALDYFDSFGSSIRIDLRGLDIMRILPKVNEALNEEWITDKVRFSYDGVKRQRIVAPLKRLLRNGIFSFVKLSWIEVYVNLFAHLVLTPPTQINFFVGKLVDMNSFYSLLSFFRRFKQYLNVECNTIYGEDPFLNLPTQYRKQYMFPSLNHIEQMDLLLLVASNLRLESPLLNIRIRKRVLTYDLPVFTVGFQSDLTYNSINLGLSSTFLLSIVEGRHPFSRYWLQKSSPSIFFSHNLIRNQLSKVLYLFRSVMSQLGTSSTLVYVGFSAASTAVFDYGVLNNFNKIPRKLSSSSLNWILNNDEICFDSHLGYTIYSGHHGDRNALLSDLILPIPSSFEKQVSYLSMTGLYQESDFVISPPNQVRSDFHFASSFFFFIESMIANLSRKTYFDINYICLKHVFARYIGYAFSPAFLSTYFNISPFLEYGYSSSSIFEFLSLPIVSSNESYYLDNSITRASHVMALAQTRFKRYNINFK